MILRSYRPLQLSLMKFLNELLGRYHADDRLRLPATVLNAILGRPEHIQSGFCRLRPAPSCRPHRFQRSAQSKEERQHAYSDRLQHHVPGRVL
jgi:hypothetical protein